VLPAVQRPHSEGENLEAAAELTLARKDFVESRIDVYAQDALYRMSKGDAGARADASQTLAAVKAGRLAGIYIVNQQVPALWAMKKLNLGWWNLIPDGEDAVLLLNPTNPSTIPPLIVFRDRVKSDPSHLDPALRKALASHRLRQTGKLRKCLPNSTLRTASEFLIGRTITNVVPLTFCSHVLECPSNAVQRRCSFQEMWNLIICHFVRGFPRVCKICDNAFLRV
jgi:hypothetical protein